MPTNWYRTIVPTLSTHVLDVAKGRPAAGLNVTLSPGSSEGATAPVHVRTNSDGRITEAIGGSLPKGLWKLSFALGQYYDASSTPGCMVAFDVTLLLDEERHYHVPLLATPFSATSYLGT
jgi:5-hydroxyisourate hydrolase